MSTRLERFPAVAALPTWIEGSAWTLLRPPLASFKTSSLYCIVACTVGLMRQEVMGLDPAYTSAPWSERPDHLPCRRALGTPPAHQHPADVGEDRAAVVFYLPQEDLVRFKYQRLT